MHLQHLHFWRRFMEHYLNRVYDAESILLEVTIIMKSKFLYSL